MGILHDSDAVYISWLQIQTNFGDNSGIIFLISQKNMMWLFKEPQTLSYSQINMVEPLW